MLAGAAGVGSEWSALMLVLMLRSSRKEHEVQSAERRVQQRVLLYF